MQCDDARVADVLSDTSPMESPGEDFDRTFRMEIAGWIQQVLERAYVTGRASLVKEAYKRDTTVEILLAAYITRVVMEKVDKEYI